MRTVIHYSLLSLVLYVTILVYILFFFHYTATTKIYTLSLHDALPISMAKAGKGLLEGTLQAGTSAVSDKLLDLVGLGGKSAADKAVARSEERFSRNAETDLVCRLLLEKKKKKMSV